MEPLVVKAGLVVTWLIFSYVCLFFFLNLEAPDGFKNAFLLMAAVLPLVGIAMTLVSNPATVNRAFSFILFYDNEQRQFITGKGWNAYTQRYVNMFANLKESDLVTDPNSDLMEATKERATKGLDFIEYGIINALTTRFGISWQPHSVTLDTPGGQMSKGGGYDPTDIVKVSPAEIRSKFSDNPFVKKYTGPAWALPAGSEIKRPVPTSVLIPRSQRTISIVNRESSLDILLTYSGGSITSAIPDIFGRDETSGDANRFSTEIYEVEIKGGFNKLLPISWNRKDKLKRWHDGIAAVLEQFDWKSVNAQLKEERAQKALELILENKRHE